METPRGTHLRVTAETAMGTRAACQLSRECIQEKAATQERCLGALNSTEKPAELPGLSQ